MLTPSLPDPHKPEMTNYKHQITNKFQISISKSQIRSKAKLLEILNFGHCDLFGICVLLFGIF